MVATPVHQNFSTTSPQDPPPADLALLRREAARFGPGLFGARRDASDAERLALARRFADLGEPTPVYVLSRAEWTDRRAKLFAAGEYADKGLTVTADHLAALVRGFDAPVPVLVEHADSPLGLGYVTAVEHEGDALYGTVTLSAEADALLRSCGASSLSVGLAPDLSRLVEVSLVRSPRVLDARLFSDGPRFDAELEAAVPRGSGVPPECPTDVPRGDGAADDDTDTPARRARDRAPVAGSARMAHSDRDAGGALGRDARATGTPDPDVDRLLSKGQLLPCQLDAARRLLGRDAETTARFDADAGGDGRGEIRRLLIDLLEARPPTLLFAEVAPVADPAAPDRAATEEAAAALLLPEEAAFYRRHFPGVALGEILKRRR